MVARKYLETVLKLQHAQYNQMAGSSFVQLLMLEYQEKGRRSGKGDDDFEMQSLEEANVLFGDSKVDEWGNDDDNNRKQVRLDLLGSYYLYYGIKIKFLQTLFQATDIQREFWMDRVITLQVQSLGGQLPPQLLQLLYMKMYRTQLSTLKLSLTLQMISHFTMWLEDAIDVNGALADPHNQYAEIVAIDQADDLITDKLYAFSTYNSYALINFQIFYIDLFLESAAVQAASAGAAAATGAAAAAGSSQSQAGSSFLEEQATAEPNTFFPFFGAAAAGGNPMMYMKYFKMMYLLLELNSARSALTSVQAENLAFQKETDNDPSNDADAEKYRTFAQQMFGSFGSNMAQASQIEYITAIFELYSMYSFMFAGAPQRAA
jgi:hypothetical protein